MLNVGFYSAATVYGPRVKKWLSMVIRGRIEYSVVMLRKLRTPASMKNRNIVDYFSWSIVFCTTQVRILYSTHGGCNRRLTEASFLPHIRAGQNPAGPPLCSEHPHGICTLVKHVHSASRADWKWSILGAVYYRSWMKCAAVKKTSQNGQFFIKSSILVLCSEHPHGICTLVKHVGIVHRVDNSWYVVVLRLE